MVSKFSLERRLLPSNSASSFNPHLLIIKVYLLTGTRMGALPHTRSLVATAAAEQCSLIISLIRLRLRILLSMTSFQVDSLFSVKGKVALVTGGSRGIGKMVSHHPRLHEVYRLQLGSSRTEPRHLLFCVTYRRAKLNRRGQVYITSRSAQDCAATEKELNALGPGQCIAIPADI